MLAEVYFTAGTDATGQFEIVLSTATALATIDVGGLEDPDLNDDGDVNGADLGLLLGQWGPCDGGACADLTGDGLINGADLGILLGSWGPFPLSCAR